MTRVDADFEATYQAMFPRLVSLGAALTGRRDVAHDLAQEAMLRAHRRWDEVSRYDAPGAWCRKVLVNLAIDHQRSVAAERRAVDRLGAVPQRLGDEPSLSQWTTLVADLTDRQRAMVTLFYADDCSVDEIADVFEVAPGTVKTTLFKARQSLARRLQREQEGDRRG